MPLMTRHYNMYTDSWRCCVSPFNSFLSPPTPPLPACRHPLRQRGIISLPPPLVCAEPYLSLVFSLNPRSCFILFYFFFYFHLLSLLFGQWVEFAVRFMSACCVLQLPRRCFVKMSFLFFFFCCCYCCFFASFSISCIAFSLFFLPWVIFYISSQCNLESPHSASQQD